MGTIHRLAPDAWVLAAEIGKRRIACASRSMRTSSDCARRIVQTMRLDKNAGKKKPPLKDG
ncbi:MAG TPA: hypothetical protein DER02_10980 [Gammaproteobacteria bacterium]|nr:hypothetical protein [Gammaproteobacteria bacterium]